MEFLRYPQVIPGFFNRRGCGPPRCLTTASACSWIGHPVSGLIPATSYALFRLALAAAPELQFLNLAANINSPDRSTKSTRSHFNVLSVLVGTRFQVLFHSPPGVLFTFPSQYYTLSVIGEYLGLEGGPPVFPPGFTCPAVLWILMADLSFRIRDSHTLWLNFPFHSTNSCQYRTQSEPQKYYYSWFGLFRVRSPLLAESRLISFPLPT